MQFCMIWSSLSASNEINAHFRCHYDSVRSSEYSVYDYMSCVKEHILVITSKAKFLIVSIPDHCLLSFYFAYQSSCGCAVWWP